jgi:hypothetical protein
LLTILKQRVIKNTVTNTIPFDPNNPYWQCNKCEFWNSDLRDVCADCEKGKKMPNSPRRPKARSKGRYKQKIKSFNGL